MSRILNLVTNIVLLCCVIMAVLIEKYDAALVFVIWLVGSEIAYELRRLRTDD